MDAMAHAGHDPANTTGSAMPSKPTLAGSYKGHALAGTSEGGWWTFSCVLRIVALRDSPKRMKLLCMSLSLSLRSAVVLMLAALMQHSRKAEFDPSAQAAAVDTPSIGLHFNPPPNSNPRPITGAVFIAWGIYVSCCVIITYLHSSSYSGRSSSPTSSSRRASKAQAPFRSRSWYALAAGPLRYFEPAFKLVMGLVAAGVELRFAAACHVAERFRWAPCWCAGAALRAALRAAAAGACWGIAGSVVYCM